MQKLLFALAGGIILLGCAASRPEIPVDRGSVEPGSKVTRGGTTELDLLGPGLKLGDQLPSVSLVDSNLRPVDLSTRRGEVLLVSIVPSLDTQVCERQTHLLGEAKLPPGIRKVTISRDLPFAQQRFANTTGFSDILYLSDFQKAEFGHQSGLLIDRLYLLARSVLVVDRDGTIRYLQVVPELSHLPDLPRAIAAAEALLPGS
ncbi:MAG TPA: peroxiredoxin [Geothermobacteraceae bacterium]|nr:peroxiredoxin [Geothermobacteraceae bacterium]